MYKFEWDLSKEQKVIRDRGIDFSTASRVFDDPYCIEVRDNRYDYGEDRYIAIGLVDNIITVAYTERMRYDENIIRIITAWKATKEEVKAYQRNRRNWYGVSYKNDWRRKK